MVCRTKAKGVLKSCVGVCGAMERMWKDGVEEAERSLKGDRKFEPEREEAAAAVAEEEEEEMLDESDAPDVVLCGFMIGKMVVNGDPPMVTGAASSAASEETEKRSSLPLAESLSFPLSSLLSLPLPAPAPATATSPGYLPSTIRALCAGNPFPLHASAGLASSAAAAADAAPSLSLPDNAFFLRCFRCLWCDEWLLCTYLSYCRFPPFSSCFFSFFFSSCRSRRCFDSSFFLAWMRMKCFLVSSLIRRIPSHGLLISFFAAIALSPVYPLSVSCFCLSSSADADISTVSRQIRCTSIMLISQLCFAVAEEPLPLR